MKTPNWAYVIGGIMVIFGLLALPDLIDDTKTDTSSFSAKKTTDAIKNKFDSLSVELENANVDSVIKVTLDSIPFLDTLQILDTLQSRDTIAIMNPPNPGVIFDELGKQFDDVFSVSEYTKKWTVRFAYLGLISAVLYILGGIFLIARTSFSIPLVYLALVISIVLAVAQMIILSSDPSSSLFTIWAKYAPIFSIIFDVTLLIIVLSSDKKAYSNEPIIGKDRDIE